MSDKGNQSFFDQYFAPFAKPIPGSLAISGSFMGFDATKRLNLYINPLQQMGEKLLLQYKNGKLGPHNVAVHEFHKLRDFYMLMTRNSMSAGALAFSEYVKETTPPLGKLQQKYADRLNAPPTSKVVNERIMRASFSPNPMVNAQIFKARFFGISAVALFPFATAFRLYQARDEDKVYECFRMGSEVAGGTLAVWKGVPAIWGATRIALPRQPTAFALVLHVVFQITAGFFGSEVGGFTADSARSRFSKVTDKL